MRFKLPRAKIGIVFGVLYFAAIVGFVAYAFLPKPVDASSEERLFMPSIGLIARVSDIERTGNQLIAPDEIAGAYQPTIHKTVIIGHSSTIFRDLNKLGDEDKFTFDGREYKTVSREILPKNLVNMEEVVSETEKYTVILMTCAGESLGGHDYSHRLVITAEEV